MVIWHTAYEYFAVAASITGLWSYHSAHSHKMVRALAHYNCHDYIYKAPSPLNVVVIMGPAFCASLVSCCAGMPPDCETVPRRWIFTESGGTWRRKGVRMTPRLAERTVRQQQEVEGIRPARSVHSS